jgi:hypothetical protein
MSRGDAVTNFAAGTGVGGRGQVGIIAGRVNSGQNREQCWTAVQLAERRRLLLRVCRGYAKDEYCNWETDKGPAFNAVLILERLSR